MAASFERGDTVRLAAAHRGTDSRHVVREYRPGDRFRVVGCVPGEPDVRVRDAADVSTLLIPAAKRRRVTTAAGADADAGAVHDGDGTGGGPVG